MLPAADEIADMVFAQLSALGEETTSDVVCTVAHAMMRGCCRALSLHYDATGSALGLSDWVAEALTAEGVAVALPH